MSGRVHAATTRVPVDDTRREVERLLKAHGADPVATVDGRLSAFVAFQLDGLDVRVSLPIIDRDAAAVASGADRKVLWRNLLLVVRAKLSAVACGISTVEREFLADVVVENPGHATAARTVGDLIGPGLQRLRGGTPGRLMIACRFNEGEG